MKSKIFSSSMVKENLKQQIWILGLTALAFIFLYPVLLMTQFDQWKAFQYPYEMIQSQYEKFLSVDGLGSVVFAVVTVMRIAGGLCGRANIGFQPIHQPLSQRRMFIKYSIITRHIIFLLFRVQKRCAGCFSLRNACPPASGSRHENPCGHFRGMLY